MKTPRDSLTQGTFIDGMLTYRHSSTHPYYLDLRAFNQGRKFFKTKAEAEAERMRQITLRERGGREAMGLPLSELAAIVQAPQRWPNTVRASMMRPVSISIT